MEATALSYEAAKAAREAAGAGEELKRSALETAAQQREERAGEMDKTMQRRMGALMTMFDDIDSGKVDVEKHWGTRKDTWAIIGMLILTMAAGGNPMDVIRGYDDRIRSKIDEEQAELERANKLGLAKVALGDNLLNMTMQIFNNTEEARAAAEALRFKALDAQLAKAMLMATSAQDKAFLAESRRLLAFELEGKVSKVAEATAGSFQRTSGRKFVPPQPIFSAAPRKVGSPEADKLVAEYYEKMQKRGANDAYADLDAVLNAIPDEGIRDKVATMIGSGKYGDAGSMLGQFFHSNPNALAAAAEYMNDYIHQMTGAQMGVQEVGRYFAAAGNMTPQGFSNFVARRGGRLDNISDQVVASMGPQRGVIARDIYNISHHNARIYRRNAGNYGRSLPASSGEAKRMSP